MREIKAALILAALVFVGITAKSQYKYPEVNKFSRQFIHNYSQREYGDSLGVQNWSITQDEHGIMYFGNIIHVLEFDGVSWDNTRTPVEATYITAIMADQSGKIFFGGNGVFGYLENEITGKKKHVTLSDSLEAEHSFFSNIWRIFEYKDNILFFAQEGIYLWNGQTIDVIFPDYSFHLAFVLNDELFVRQRGYGLMKYTDGEFKLIPGGDIFKEYGVFGMYLKTDGNILITSQEIGLYKYAQGKTISKLKTNYEKYFNNAGIIGGTMLHDGNIALNTTRNGVIIINQKGEIISIIDQNSGLRDNDVKQVFQDRDNRLWLALNTGISMVNYDSNVWLYDYNTGLFGTTQSVIIHDEEVFTGTNTGLYKKNKLPDERIFKHFSQIEGLNSEIKQLLSVGKTLLIGSQDGLYAFEKNKGIFQIAEIDASALYWSDKTKRLFVSGENGLFIFSQKPKWQMLASYEEFAVSNPLNIAESPGLPDNVNIIWIGGIGDGVWRIIIFDDFSYDFDFYVGSSDGLGTLWVRPVNYQDRVLFGVFNGLLRFVDENEILETLPDSIRDNSVDFRGYFEHIELPGIANMSISHLAHAFGKTWVNADYNIFYGDNIDSLSHYPFQTINMGRIFDIAAKNSSTLWLATDDGLAKVKTDLKTNYTQKPIINIRKIITGADSVLYYAYNAVTDKPSTTLPYSSNAINISYASAFEENAQQAMYSYKLGGFDNDWSEWSHITQSNYVNLREGNYNFMVKAKDAYNNESDISTFSFRVLPPWYRTFWAYVLYGVCFILLVLIIVKLSIMRLKAKNIQLEKIIEKRTEEIRNQKDEIARQHKVVLQQKDSITSSIRYASRIQNALVPQEDFLLKHIPESFIFWIPRDIVSGDFYWIKSIPPYISIVAADCTGHGVPGAFMSMLGISFLNELAQREKPGEVSKVLEHLRLYIKDTLGQTGDRTEQKDGMVLAFCTINTDNNKLYFAGANTPLWLIRNNELIEYKGTKNPIGIHPREIPFEAHQIQLQKNDAIYMFSDGYVDQFGGPEGRKLGKRALGEMLLKINNLPMQEQKQILDKNLKNWMTDEYTQIDDILVMGIRV